jgi:multiple sugar transport system substrate-binding protein
MICKPSIRIATLVGICLFVPFHSGRSESAESSTAFKQQPVTLNVWIMPNAQARTAESFYTLVQPFTRENPQVKVAVTIVPWRDAWEAILDIISGGPAPDIIQLGTTWVATAAASGKLLDLTGKYDERLFPKEVLATTTLEDPKHTKIRRYAMPWIVDSRALYYNKAACAKVGVDPTKDFATWASFKEALRKLKNVEVNGKRLEPFAVPQNNWDVVHTLSWLIWGWGGGFISRNSAESGINSPGSLAGIEYAIDLFREGLMVHRPDTGDMRVIAKMLEKGEVATAIGYPIPTLSGERFGVTLIPEGPKGRFTFLGGSTLAILKSSNHRKDALALIKYLSDQAVQFAYSNLTGLLPAAAAEYDEIVLQLDPVRTLFVKQMKYGKAYPSIPQWANIENILRDGLNEVWGIVQKPGPYDTVAVRNRIDGMAKKIDGTLRAP